MPERNGERQVIDYASPPPRARERSRRPLTVNEFGCALVAVLYGIPLILFLIFSMSAFFERD